MGLGYFLHGFPCMDYLCVDFIGFCMLVLCLQFVVVWVSSVFVWFSLVFVWIPFASVWISWFLNGFPWFFYGSLWLLHGFPWSLCGPPMVFYGCSFVFYGCLELLYGLLYVCMDPISARRVSNSFCIIVPEHVVLVWVPPFGPVASRVLLPCSVRPLRGQADP